MGKCSHLLTQKVKVKAQTGLDGSGRPTFGSQTILKARVERKANLIHNEEGEEIQTNHVVLTETEIDRSSRVWLPGDDIDTANDGRTPEMVIQASTPAGDGTIYETWL